MGPTSYENSASTAGFDYRMSEITAAVSREQLKRLPTLTKQRLGMVEKYGAVLNEFHFLRPLGVASCESPPNELPLGTHYVFQMLTYQTIAGVSRQGFGNAFSGEGIPVGLGYVKPLYSQPLDQSSLRAHVPLLRSSTSCRCFLANMFAHRTVATIQ